MLDDEVRLGARATIATLKQLSEKHELAKYRIVHFATHGVLAGEIMGADEPGLLLTPPEIETQDDNGYLAASDIASLELDAEWVVLSACNTAAAGVKGGEMLSGLARAFFFARTRALLVSHWYVPGGAAAKLATGAILNAHNTGIGRSEALRRVMENLITSGKSGQAHPSFWASFVVIGEGARLP